MDKLGVGIRITLQKCMLFKRSAYSHWVQQISCQPNLKILKLEQIFEELSMVRHG